MTFFTEIYPFEDFTSAHKPRGGSSAYSISDRPSLSVGGRRYINDLVRLSVRSSIHPFVTPF